MFKYQRLSSDVIEIRLLEIQSASSLDDAVHLRLYHVPFHSNHTYSALSYTWGSPAAHFPSEWDDPSSTATIWVNGDPFEVRRNLESALRHLRKFSWMIQTFWIDAICIDQNFVPERNDQVMRMKDIYSKAIGTVVWLGPADDDTHLAVKKIGELFELWKARSKTLKTWPINAENIDEYAAVLEVEFGDEVSLQTWNAFLNFFKRSWWRRAWVLQEVFAAPETIVIAGEITVPWSAIMHTCNILTQHTTSEVVVPSLSSSRMKAVIALCEKVTTPAKILHLYHQGEASGHRESLWGTRDRVLPPISLVQALRLLRPMLSSDPRDKVYAALGISQNIEAIQPDYSLDVEAVYRDTALQILKVNDDLHVLDHCAFPPTLPGCPSWVPDWSNKSRAKRHPLPKKGMVSGYGRQQHHQPVYSAGGGGPPSVGVENNRKTLVLQGRVLDRLEFVGAAEEESDDDADQSAYTLLTEEEWLAEEAKTSKRKEWIVERAGACRWLHDWALHREATGNRYECIGPENWHYQVEGDHSQFRQLRLLPSNKTLDEAYWSTLAADLMYDEEASSFNRATNKTLERALPKNFFSSVLSTTLPGRTFAVSKHGFIGLVPEECQVGDIICIIQGSEVPFILRDVDGKGCFIGECFVHGMMDGEALEGISTSGGFKDVPIS